MIERYTTSAVIAKFLGLNLQTEAGRDVILKSQLPGFMKSPGFIDALASLSPDGSVLGSLKSIKDMAGNPDLLSEKGIPVLASMFPRHASVIEGAYVAYRADPEAFQEHLLAKVTPERFEKAVQSVILTDKLLRCPDCGEAFHSNGTKPCPYCKG